MKKASTTIDVILSLMFLFWLSDLDFMKMTPVKWVCLFFIIVWFALNIWKVLLWRKKK